MAPSTLRVDGMSRDSVTLRWDAPRDTGGVPLSGYIVEQQDGGKAAPAGTAARWKVAAYVDPAQTWWTVGGLIQGYEYWFRVRAENPDGAGSACTLSSAVVPKSVARELRFRCLDYRVGESCVLNHRFSETNRSATQSAGRVSKLGIIIIIIVIVVSGRPSAGALPSPLFQANSVDIVPTSIGVEASNEDTALR